MKRDTRFEFAALMGALILFTGVCVAQDGGHPPVAPPPATPPPAASQPVIPSGPIPRLQLSMEEFDFGTVWEGDPIKTEVVIKNIGEAPLKLSPPRASCSCTAAKPDKDVLEPGQTTSVAVSVNSLKKRGDVHTVVTFSSNDPVKPETTLQIKGHVKPLLDMKPTTGVSFGRISTGPVESREVEIENLSGKPAKLELVPPGPEMSNLEVKLETVQEGLKYKLIVATKPPLKDGTIQQSVLIKTNIEKLPELRVSVTGIVAPRVSVTPPVLNLPANMPRAQERPVNLNFTADKPVKITSMKIVGSDNITVEEAPSNVKRQPNDKNQFQSLRVKLPAGTQIPAEGAELQIETDDAEFPKFVIPIKVIQTPVRNRPGQPGATTQPSVSGGPPITRGKLIGPATSAPAQPTPAQPTPVQPTPAQPSPAGQPAPPPSNEGGD